MRELEEKIVSVQEELDNFSDADWFEDLNFNDWSNGVDGVISKAELLTDLDKKDEAIEMLQILVKKKPELVDANKMLGDLLMEKEINFDLAEKMFNLKGNVFSFSESVKPQ